MAYIWHVNLDGQVELHEDAIKLIPSLAYFEPKYVKYIVLFADYRYSPIWNFPDAQRDKIAKLKSGFFETEDLINNPEIQAAISEFTSLIYDERRDMRQILQRQLEEQKQKLRNGVKDFKEMKEVMELSKYLENEIARIETKLSSENFDDDPDIKGDKTLSYVEKWMRRRKKYLAQLPADAH
jgi:hypothetical protein